MKRLIDKEGAPSGALVVGVARSVSASHGSANVSAAAVTLVRLGAFCDALSGLLGVRIEPRQARSYEELASEVEKGRVAIAWLPPAVALGLTAQGRALPVALPVRRGNAVFHSALFVRADSRFERIEDLEGTSAAWVDPSSASGYLVIRAALRASGRRPSRLFARERFEGSHEAVVRSVMDGRADVGATYFHRGASGEPVNAGWGSHEVRILLEYGPIPADLIAAAVSVPSALIHRLRVALLECSDGAVSRAACELFEAERFVRADPTHLGPLERLLTHLDDGTGRRGPSVVPPRR